MKHNYILVLIFHILFINFVNNAFLKNSEKSEMKTTNKANSSDKSELKNLNKAESKEESKFINDQNSKTPEYFKAKTKCNIII